MYPLVFVWMMVTALHGILKRNCAAVFIGGHKLKVYLAQLGIENRSNHPEFLVYVEIRNPLEWGCAKQSQASEIVRL